MRELCRCRQGSHCAADPYYTLQPCWGGVSFDLSSHLLHSEPLKVSHDALSWLGASWLQSPDKQGDVGGLQIKVFNQQTLIWDKLVSAPVWDWGAATCTPRNHGSNPHCNELESLWSSAFPQHSPIINNHHSLSINLSKRCWLLVVWNY